MNQTPIPNLQRSAQNHEKMELDPTFWRTLYGMWLLTLRSKVSLKKIPILLFGLLVFPALTFYILAEDPPSAFQHILVIGICFGVTPLYCLNVFGGMMRDELLADTMGFLITRPITRARLLVVKYLSHVLWIQIILFIELALFVAVGTFHGIRETEYNLSLVSIQDANNLPQQGHELVFVGKLGDELLFRIFDETGKMVLDKRESEISNRDGELATFKALLEEAWDQRNLSEFKRKEIIESVTSITGRPQGAMIRLIPIFLGIQIISIFVWGAISSLLGLISQKYVVMGILYGLIVEFGIERIPGYLSKISMVEHLKVLFGNIGQIQLLYDWPSEGTLWALFALFLSTTVYLSLACLLFHLKEFTHSDEVSDSSHSAKPIFRF